MRLFSYLLFVLAFFVSSQSEAAVIKNVRSGAYEEKTRIVLDLDDIAQYTQSMTGNRLIVNIDADAARENVLYPKGELVQKVTVQKNGVGKTRLSVDLAEEPGNYKIFALKSPQRLVIDFYKYARSKQVTEVEPGLRYISWRDYQNNKPVWLHVLEVDPGNGYELRPILGQANSIDKGRLSAATQQAGALAAINASYFDKTKWIIGNLKIDDEWVSCDFTPRTALIIGRDGKPKIISELSYEGRVTRADGKSAEITGMNRERQTNELILYNSYYGKNTGSNKFGREVRIANGVVTEIGKNGSLPLRPGSLVLSGHGAGAEFLKTLRRGNRLDIKQTLAQNEADEAKHVVGAGPLLVVGGKARVMAAEEQFPADIARGKAPRTAVGVKADGGLLLVVVEGRTQASAGLTLEELAGYMIKLGAAEAMNFDGGGSSEMVLNSKIVNYLSDGSERLVRAGLGLFKH